LPIKYRTVKQVKIQENIWSRQTGITTKKNHNFLFDH
jgi:hypothetical protein